MSRLTDRFAALAARNRAAFVAYLMAGDPDHATALEIACALPAAGVDVIELGVPFTDPMADGPAIQAAGQRALAAGASVESTLATAAAVRAANPDTPIVLMGYYNPIHARGVERFLAEAAAAGVDALIVVDLPPEEDAELRRRAAAAGLALIRLATPTTDAARLPAVLRDAAGFVYYVSIAGVTGAAAADPAAVGPQVARIKAHTDLPVCVGFGVRTPEAAAAVARVADGVVIGSAIVRMIGEGARPTEVLDFVRRLAEGVHVGR